MYRERISSCDVVLKYKLEVGLVIGCVKTLNEVTACNHYNKTNKCIIYIECVPLATEPGISLIILTPMKVLQEYVRCVRNENECVCSVCL